MTTPREDSVRIRKTIAISDIKARANAMLVDSDTDLIEGREAIAIFLESILMTTGNYHGYIQDEPVTDDSRRRYF